MADEYGKWISVKEKLPEFGTIVLVFDGSTKVIDTAWRVEDDKQVWVWYLERTAPQDEPVLLDEQVTHWMPLPNPPEGETR